jgi:Ca-activated chloride channel family protein
MSNDETAAIELKVACDKCALPSLAEDQMLYALAAISATGYVHPTRVPLNLCLVLDHSSSMHGEKLKQAKESAKYIAHQMRSGDRLTLVVFSDRAKTLIVQLGSTAAQTTSQLIDAVEARGGTEIYAGLTHGLEAARKQQTDAFGNHVVLLTDGHTYGDEKNCLEAARAAREAGIFLTVLGVGTEWNDEFLTDLAIAGGGALEYIDSPRKIVEVFQAHLRNMQTIYAREANLHVRPAEGVRLKDACRVSPYITNLTREDASMVSFRGSGPIGLGYWERDLPPGGDRASPQQKMGAQAPTPLEHSFRLGYLGQEADQAFLLELIVSPQATPICRLAQVRLDYLPPDDDVGKSLEAEIILPALTTSQVEIDPKVRDVVERVTAFRLQEKAWASAQAGDIPQATQLLKAASTRLLSLGESELSQAVFAEAQQMERTGQTSSIAVKRIRYGTRGLVPFLPRLFSRRNK